MNFLYIFLSFHRAQQPRSGWPSNVFRRWYRDLAHPSPNFTAVKSVKSGLVFNITQQGQVRGKRGQSMMILERNRAIRGSIIDDFVIFCTRYVAL